MEILILSLAVIIIDIKYFNSTVNENVIVERTSLLQYQEFPEEHSEPNQMSKMEPFSDNN